jgi:hypothetical protein
LSWFVYVAPVIAVSLWPISRRWLEKTASNPRGTKLVAALPVVAAILFACLLAWRDDQSGATHKKEAFGDAEHPPFADVISLPGNLRFIVTNESNYPAYGVIVSLRDTSGDGFAASRTYEYQEIQAHSGRLDDRQWPSLPPAPSERRFAAAIFSRSGTFSEEIILRRSGNNQWMRALKLSSGPNTITEHADSAWPRDVNGRLQW